MKIGLKFGLGRVGPGEPKTILGSLMGPGNRGLKIRYYAEIKGNGEWSESL